MTDHDARRADYESRAGLVGLIDTGLADAIGAQQQAVLADFPAAACLLPRPTRNPDGQQPFSTATFRGELIAWLHACDIRDELGQPVHVTPHQWRHSRVICSAFSA